MALHSEHLNSTTSASPPHADSVPGAAHKFDLAEAGRDRLSTPGGSPNERLTRRGIAEQARVMGWRTGDGKHAGGWVYSIRDTSGKTVARRWKNYDSAGTPKTFWIDAKASYYHIGKGLQQAITDADGLLYIVNGEPAVLTVRAAERDNVLSFFGEGAVPEDLIAFLGDLGVRTVRYYPDNDKAGQDAALKLRDTLQDSGIVFDCRALPADVPAKGDTNDLWQLLSFDATAFWTALDGAPAYVLPAPAPVIQQREFTRGPDTADHRDEYDREVMAVVERTARKSRGKKFYCINPSHDDKHPSSRIGKGRNGGMVYYCTCGTHSLTTVGDWLNMNFRAWLSEHYPRPAKTRVHSHKGTVDQPTTVYDYARDAVTADVTMNQRYLGDLPTASVIALKSDIDTGKTTLSVRESSAATSAMFIVPRSRLAENISHAAERMDEKTIEDYQALSHTNRRKPARLAICTPSYSALAGDEPGLPVPETLILDEWEQHLEFIYGDTGVIFEGRAAIDAAEAMKYVIKKTPRIIAIDAHISNLGIGFLRAQGRDVVTVVNEHVTPRGALTIHANREGAIAQGRALLLENAGTVAFAVASEKRAALIATELVDLLGSSADVLLLTAETAGGERQNAFFADPNGQIGQYRAIVYSPVLDMGFDITTPVRAVVGVMAPHLTAYSARQMIGRCRHTQETHVYLPLTSGGLEEDPAAIEAVELQKAARTLKKLNDSGVRVTEDIDRDQLDYLRWHACVMARRNASINHLREHFISLCKGYTLAFSEATDPALQAKLQAIKDALDEQRKAMVLTVAPVDDETFRKLRDAGKVDESAIVGNLRAKIEAVTGAMISPRVRDQLWTVMQRRTVRNFTDLIDHIAEIKSADQREQLDGVPLPKRRHRSVRRNVANAFLRAVIDSDGVLLNLDKDALEQATAPLIEHFGGDLKRLFGWRPDRCKSAAATVRRVFDTIGVKLESEQRTVNGKHVRCYQINAAGWREMVALATQRLDMLNAKRNEDTTPAPNLKTAISRVSKGDGTFKTDEAISEQPVGWAAEPERFDQQFTAALGSTKKRRY